MFVFCKDETLSLAVLVFSFTLYSVSYAFLFSLSLLIVTDLDEKLHRSEADRLNCAQRVKVLEGQLQAVRGELADTLEQLRELRDVLQRTQTISDERQTVVENLTVQLR